MDLYIKSKVLDLCWFVRSNVCLFFMCIKLTYLENSLNEKTSFILRNWALFLPMLFSLSTLSVLIDHLEMRFNSAVNWTSGSKIHFCLHKCCCTCEGIGPATAPLHWLNNLQTKHMIKSRYEADYLKACKKEDKSLTLCWKYQTFMDMLCCLEKEKLSNLFSNLAWCDMFTKDTFYCVHEKMYFEIVNV